MFLKYLRVPWICVDSGYNNLAMTDNLFFQLENPKALQKLLPQQGQRKHFDTRATREHASGS